MSLQQKMVEIRRMIPALTKKTYSEEVSYDFIKIDDIFQYLTPALNRYGVNFDILSEKATKADEHGNPIYVQYLSQSQNWMYEADLTLSWINADDPQDMDKRTIHAIGTHEMPDKAKGSAWTYALKYYLLNRFCIDQGASGEDPDLYSHPVIDEENQKIKQEETQDAYEQENDEEMEPKIEGRKPDPDEFQAVGDEEVPFEQNDRIPPASTQIRPESGRMVQLPETAAAPTPEAVTPVSPKEGMTVEEASQVICRCGTYRDWPLGRIAQEKDGFETLEWLAHRYRGKDEAMRQGAQILVKAAKAA